MSAPTIVVLPVDTTGQPVFVAGDVGIGVQLPAGQIQSLTGATCLVAIVGPGGVRHTVSATPSGDGTNAAFTTAATDFPVAGVYSLQLGATFSSPAEVVYADVETLTVGPRI